MIFGRIGQKQKYSQIRTFSLLEKEDLKLDPFNAYQLGKTYLPFYIKHRQYNKNLSDVLFKHILIPHQTHKLHQQLDPIRNFRFPEFIIGSEIQIIIGNKLYKPRIVFICQAPQ